MRDDFEEARRLIERSRASLADLGLRRALASTAVYSSWVELLADDARAAELELRAAFDLLDGMGESYALSTVAALLGESLLRQDQVDEAASFSEISEARAPEQDVISQVFWRGVRAKALARDGDRAAAESLARDAVERAAATDFIDLCGTALADLGQVLGCSGASDEAAPVLGEALELYRAKGNLASARRVQGFLDVLRKEGSLDLQGVKR
jgi:hypothetical protein